MSDQKDPKVNLQQLRFAQGYVAHGNATKAAIDAGYSEKTAEQIGYQLLQKTSVLELISKARQEATEKLKMSAYETVVRLAALARSNIRSVASWRTQSTVKIHFRNDGSTSEEEVVKTVLKLKDSHELTEWEAYAIESVKVTYVDGEQVVSIKMRNPQQALDTLKEIHRLVGAAEGDEASELKAALAQLDREEREKRAAKTRKEPKDGARAKKKNGQKSK